VRLGRAADGDASAIAGERVITADDVERGSATRRDGKPRS
jgi:hypothetical protein